MAATTSQNPTPNCFSSLLHRLLCSGSVPTHPSSDHISTSYDTVSLGFPKKECQTEPKITKVEATTSPGVVARLMGLDSLPTNTNWVPKHRTLESFLRSRSVNFVDYLPEFDPKQAEHRRVRTSVSFREDPAFFNQERNDFLVLCFEKQLGKTKDGLGKKSEVGFEGIGVKKTERSKNKENMSQKALLREKNGCREKNNKPNKSLGKSSSKVGNNFHGNPTADLKSRTPEKPKTPKLVPVRSSQRKKKKNQLSAKKVVPECEPVNPSPVFEIQDCSISPKASLSDSGLMSMSSKTKSPPKMATWDDPSPNFTRAKDDRELRRMGKEANEASKKREAEYYVQLPSQICKLTEEDVKKSTWVAKDLFEFADFQEICIEFGNQVVEQVLNQVVDELVGLHLLKNLAL